jgi:hypothetical protein
MPPAAAAGLIGFDQDVPRRPDLGIEMPPQSQRTALAQPPRPLFHDLAVKLRHARRRRSRPRRERKDVQMRQPARLDQIERVVEHRFRLGRETGDEVGAERHVWPQPA